MNQCHRKSSMFFIYFILIQIKKIVYFLFNLNSHSHSLSINSTPSPLSKKNSIYIADTTTIVCNDTTNINSKKDAEKVPVNKIVKDTKNKTESSNVHESTNQTKPFTSPQAVTPTQINSKTETNDVKDTKIIKNNTTTTTTTTTTTDLNNKTTSSSPATTIITQTTANMMEGSFPEKQSMAESKKIKDKAYDIPLIETKKESDPAANNNNMNNNEEKKKNGLNNEKENNSPNKIKQLRKRKKEKKVLVLDLDETLIHSTSRGSRNHDYMIEVLLDKHICLYYIYKRPHVDNFLKKVSEWYKVVIYTASMKEYADPVIDYLDPTRSIFSGRYFRESCQYRNGLYMKDLQIIEKDLSQVCLVDNSPFSYEINKENGIPIETWINDPKDKELLNLLPFLDALRFVEDVRSILSLRL